MIARIKDWLEDRTGAASGAAAFLGERIPKSIGWRNTFGSVVGALLLVQIVTGFLLALYYVPHPDAAYDSVAFIEEEVMGGGLVRALHFWGASFVIVGLFLHMSRTFLSGAYKKPREMTWLFGIALFGVVIGLAFSGQLLPWNQDGYWAASVGIEIAASAPLVGGVVRKLLMGGDVVGALTLTRFYAMHIVLLPALLGLLVGGHVYLLRRHGPTPLSSDTSGDMVAFHPYQSFRDIVVVSVAFIGLAGVSLYYGGPDRGAIDWSGTGHMPRPEWYLLSHYQILRMMPGSMKVFATFVLPAVALIALVALPWLDRSKGTSFRQRPVVVSAGLLAIFLVVGLTAWGVATEPGTTTAEVDVASDEYDPVDAGRRVYRKAECPTCHKINRRGKDVGPDLSYVGSRLQPDYLREWIENPQTFNPDTPMPVADLTGRELDEITAYLMTLRREGTR